MATTYTELVRDGHVKTQALRDRIQELENALRGVSIVIKEVSNRVASSAEGYESEDVLDLLSGASMHLGRVLGE